MGRTADRPMTLRSKILPVALGPQTGHGDEARGAITVIGLVTEGLEEGVQ
jgi:hypothetical protein